LNALNNKLFKLYFDTFVYIDTKQMLGMFFANIFLIEALFLGKILSILI